MTDTLEDRQRTASIEGRTITNLRFVDHIDGLAGKEEELTFLLGLLDKPSAPFGMEISAEKIKLITTITNGISINIRVNGEKLDEVDSESIWAQSS